MNKTLLLIICDFLLLNLLALTRWEQVEPPKTPTPPAASVPIPGESAGPANELVEVMRLSLADEQAAREELRFQNNGDGGFEWVFPARRQRSLTLGLLLFVIAWSSVCVALWIFATAPVPVALFFTLFDVILLLALGNMLFVARGIAIDPGRNECVTWAQVGMFPRQERHIPFGSVLDVQSQRAGQSGNTIYYRVVLLIDGGAPVTVGSGLGLWNNAESIAGLLRAAMKLG